MIKEFRILLWISFYISEKDFSHFYLLFKESCIRYFKNIVFENVSVIYISDLTYFVGAECVCVFVNYASNHQRIKHRELTARLLPYIDVGQDFTGRSLCCNLR